LEAGDELPQGALGIGPVAPGHGKASF
jgi:hypothetical protein